MSEKATIKMVIEAISKINERLDIIEEKQKRQ